MSKDRGNQRLIPTIRFKGFTDDWEQRKLGDVVTRLKSYPLSRDVETTENSGYRYVHYGDIHTRVADVIDDEGVLPQINPGKYEPIQTGDLCLADASEDYQDIAAPSVLLAEHKDNVVAGLHTIALRPNDADPLFLYFLFKAPDFRHYVYREGQGLKVFGISARGVLNYTYAFPSMTEQAKIVKLLRSFDTTIALHQRKYENLQAVKKELLKRMFASDKKPVPDFRFNGYTNDWEQRKLSDIGHLDSKTIDPQQHPDESFHEYSMPAFDNGQQPDYVLGHSMQSGRQYITGKVLLVNKLNVRKKRIWLVQDAQENSVASGEFLPYVSDLVELSFLHQQLISPQVTKRMVEMSSGTSNSQKRITPQAFLGMNLFVPKNKAEQILLGEYLDAFDTALALHQRKLEDLKQLKKVLLQKLFV